MSFVLIWVVVLAAARPAHYDTRYPALSHEGRHRLFLMHVVNQQFARLYESDVDWDETHNRRLADMAFHLAQWHMTPECGVKRSKVMDQLVANWNVMFAAYHDRGRNATAWHRLDAIHALYRTIQLGGTLAH
jgi:hypothetical protein